MAYTTVAFGTGDAYNITYPDTDRLFVFSPYYIEVEGSGVAQEVTLTFNGIELKQFTGANRKCIFPLCKLLESVFKGRGFGYIEPNGVDSHVNSGSNLWYSDDETVINVKVGTDVNDISLNYKLIFGALQQGETEPTIVNIYKFGDALPITITQLIGDKFENTPDTWSEPSIGTEIWLNGLSNGENILILDSEDEVIKTYIVNNLPDCTRDTMYLCWVSPNDGYKYYQFRIGKRNEVSKVGSTFNQNVFSIEPVNGVYRNRRKTLSKPTGEVITLVEPSADKTLVEHIKGVFSSPIVMLYVGDRTTHKWLEVNVAESQLEEVWNGGNREIQVNIIMPDKYVLSL